MAQWLMTDTVKWGNFMTNSLVPDRKKIIKTTAIIIFIIFMNTLVLKLFSNNWKLIITVVLIIKHNHLALVSKLRHLWHNCSTRATVFSVDVAKSDPRASLWSDSGHVKLMKWVIRAPMILTVHLGSLIRRHISKKFGKY